MAVLDNVRTRADVTTKAAPQTEAPQTETPHDESRALRSGSALDNALLYGSFAAFSILTFCFGSEDAFITLRYAANLDHGLGAVFNPGQHVEGFTSPLHLLIVAGVYLVPGGHALLKIKLVSLVFGLLTLVAGKRLAALAHLPRWARVSPWSSSVAAGRWPWRRPTDSRRR